MPKLVFQTGLRRQLGLEEITLSSGPCSVRELVKLAERERGISLLPALVDERGDLYLSVMILLNGRNIRLLDGLDTLVGPDDTLMLFPPSGGG